MFIRSVLVAALVASVSAAPKWSSKPTSTDVGFAAPTDAPPDWWVKPKGENPWWSAAKPTKTGGKGGMPGYAPTDGGMWPKATGFIGHKEHKDHKDHKGEGMKVTPYKGFAAPTGMPHGTGKGHHSKGPHSKGPHSKGPHSKGPHSKGHHSKDHGSKEHKTKDHEGKKEYKTMGSKTKASKTTKTKDHGSLKTGH